MTFPAEPIVVRSLGRAFHQEALAAAGDLYWQAERGVARDLFSAYGRLLELLGREISDVPPAGQGNGRPLIAFTAQRIPASRVATLHCAVGAALRNATALDAARHWRDADAAMKGFALAEALLMSAVASAARDEAAKLRLGGYDGQAEQCERIAEIRDTDSDVYRLLASGEGW